ncbi:MAG: hypothetical protein ACREHD_19715 [Pirellulales bacterium]
MEHCQALRFVCRFAVAVLFAFSTGQAWAGEPGNAEPADGQLVDQFDRHNRAFEGFLRVEVASTLHHAREIMATRPAEAENMLRVLRDKMRHAPDVDANFRAEVANQIDAALRMAHREAEVRREQVLQRDVAQHRQAERSTYDSAQEQKKVQFATQFNALMAEHRYGDAEMLASVAEESNPDQVAFRNAALLARLSGNTADANTMRLMREKGVLDAWRAQDVANIPATDQPPILFPDPEAWQRLTEQRKRHAVDVKPYTPAELKVLDALDEKTACDFIDEPLCNVLDYFKQRHGIEIQLDNRALAAAGIDPLTPITRNAQGITLRSALGLLLHDLGLTYTLRYEVLLITSQTEADSMRDVRIYPVADLVNTNPFYRRAARRYGISGMSRAAAAGYGAF